MVGLKKLVHKNVVCLDIVIVEKVSGLDMDSTPDG